MPIKRTFKCPQCKQAVEKDAPHFPFCGERCRLIDLGKWANQEYSIPGDPAPLPEDDVQH